MSFDITKNEWNLLILELEKQEKKSKLKYFFIQMFKTKNLSNHFSIFERPFKLVIGIEYKKLFFSSNLISFWFPLRKKILKNVSLRFGFRLETNVFTIYLLKKHIRILRPFKCSLTATYNYVVKLLHKMYANKSKLVK